MKIAIIGAGFTGLSAAYYLAKQGHTVCVYEKDALPGGLAQGFKDPKWAWSLDKHYHHIFTSDLAIQNLASSVGHEIVFTTPKTSTLYANSIFQLDSPKTLFSFPHLSLVDKIRTAIGLAVLKLNPFWHPFESITAKSFIKAVMGENSWKILWEPLFLGKFGSFTDSISTTWFWARIFKRSQQLGYPTGGFEALARTIEKAAIDLGVKFYYQHPISRKSDLPSDIDKTICTIPGSYISTLFPQLPQDYKKQLANTQGVGAVNVVLSLKHQFLQDNTYWLNVNDAHPFLAVVEHTNFIAAKHYNSEHLVYIGNYLPANHKYFTYTSNQLLQEFLPALQRIQPHFSLSWVNNSWVHSAKFAQPLIGLHHKKNILPIATPLKDVYLATMAQVYPWDRGTNYAVELGEKVASVCTKR